jgi:UDP-N-acetylmuramoyl-L-alanyl-D-glutamate--2,6-diaminopimelate ligase
MLLADLLTSIIPITVRGDTLLEVRGICYDSRQVSPGGLFFALRGEASDGHRFIGAAVEQGAVAVVLEDETYAPAGVTWVKVADARLAMSLLAASYYNHPTATVPLIGITGTNGKTTTTYLVEAMLEEAGLPAAVLGTVSYRFRELTTPAPHTTPESAELQRILRELVDLGAKAVVMEVSSHALEQRRVDGCSFDVGVFTNLTRDHLDYHHDMTSYLASKRRLFAELLVPDAAKPKKRAVVNLDDSYGEAIVAASACLVVSYGLSHASAVTMKDVTFSVAGIAGTLVTPVGEMPVSSPMVGRFNLYNVLAAAGVGVALGLPLTAIARGIAGHKRVPGRLERVDNDRGVSLLVDYAHTGDALENVLLTLRDLSPRRLITVFGCGGDRDRGKRPVMGEISGRLSDLSVVTSDNPRTEEPRAILAEIRAGILPLGIREYTVEELIGLARLDDTAGLEKGFVMVENRREAIRLAVRLARPGDIVLLAGKGHEDYQIVGREKLHFDDREEATDAFREL